MSLPGTSNAERFVRDAYRLQCLRIDCRKSVISVEPTFIKFNIEQERQQERPSHLGINPTERSGSDPSADRGFEYPLHLPCVNPIGKKPPCVPPCRISRWMAAGGGKEACREVRGSWTEVHERVPRVGKYTSLLSRGSSYGRRRVVAGKRSEISVARGSAPVRDSSASGMPASGASERSSPVRAPRNRRFAP